MSDKHEYEAKELARLRLEDAMKEYVKAAWNYFDSDFDLQSEINDCLKEAGLTNMWVERE